MNDMKHPQTFIRQKIRTFLWENIKKQQMKNNSILKLFILQMLNIFTIVNISYCYKALTVKIPSYYLPTKNFTLLQK